MLLLLVLCVCVCVCVGGGGLKSLKLESMGGGGKMPNL